MGTVYIKNQEQLRKVLQSYVASALEKTQEEIYDVIQKSINEYYREYTPSFYQRTYKFLNSLVKPKVEIKGNSIECEVKIDEEYLRYHYPGSNFANDYPATGQDVVSWANRDVPGAGNHGYTVDEGRDIGFWDEGIQTLGGEIGIIRMLVYNLEKRGLKVVK